MAMNISAGGGDENAPVAEINVTPLVDVMLVLLIIFMVTAPLMISQVPVTLPKASLDEMGKPVDPLILSTDLQGTYYLEQNGKTSEFPEAQLQPQLDEMYTRYSARDGKENFPVVYIRADDTAKYGKVYKLVKTLAKTGFYKVSLISEANQ